MVLSQNLYVKVGRLVAFIATCLLILSVPLPVFAANGLEHTLIGTHPNATSQATSYGKIIRKIEILDNKLYAGYGDYNTNTGPIHINPLNLNTNSFSGSVLTVPTEEINQFRIIGDKLYAPTIDPTCGGTCAAGFAVGEPWENKAPLTAAHLYDIATLTGTDLWIAGSTEASGVATLWRSTDGGDTWEVEQTDESETSSDFERYYWVAVINDKLYVQANNVNPQPPVRIFDGATWTEGTTELIAPSESHVVVFDNKIISLRDGLSAFDGNTFTNIDPGNGQVLDIYVGDDGYLYALSTNGVDRQFVSRTQNLEDWIKVGEAAPQATSIAVNDGNLYVGTADSKIYKASLAAVPTIAPTVSLGGLVDNSTVSGSVTLRANINSQADIATITFLRGFFALHTYTDDSELTYEWDTTALKERAYTLQVQIEDEFGNTANSEPITVRVDNTIIDSDNPNNTYVKELINSISEAAGYELPRADESSTESATQTENTQNDDPQINNQTEQATQISQEFLRNSGNKAWITAAALISGGFGLLFIVIRFFII